MGSEKIMGSGVFVLTEEGFAGRAQGRASRLG